MKAKLQAGFGLIEVLIAGALAMGLMIAASKWFLDVSKSSRKNESSLDLTSLRGHIMSSLSCANTIAATPNCLTSNVDAEVRNANSGIVIPSTGTTMGRFFVRARCEDGTAGGLAIRAVRLTTAGTADAGAKTWGAASNAAFYQRDEMNGNLSYDWGHPKGALFAVLRDPGGNLLQDGRLCKTEFGNPLATPGPSPSTAPTATPSTPTGVASCPTGSIPGGTLADGSLVCMTALQLQVLANSLPINVSNCPSGRALRGIQNGVPNCVTLPTNTGGTTTVSQPTSSGSSQWLLDRDCGPSLATDPNACSHCQAMTSMTCPANPGGLSCSVSSGTRCVTPQGCRRYVCR